MHRMDVDAGWVDVDAELPLGQVVDLGAGTRSTAVTITRTTW
jgi:hypothetical protein